MERHCHLRGDGDGCAVRRRVLSLGRLAGVSVNHYGRGAGGHFVGDPASDGKKASKGKPLPFRAVLGRVWLYGMALALASAGFGVIATFITLFYDAKGWDGAAFALTLFSCAFVGTRLLFPNGINRIGGLNVAMICFSVEIIGLLLVGVATMPWMAKIGVLLAGGAGFSLVFPALGVVAVKAVPQQNQGGGAGNLHRIYGFIAWRDWTTGWAGDELGGRTGDLSGGGGTGRNRVITDVAIKKTASGTRP